MRFTLAILILAAAAIFGCDTEPQSCKNKSCCSQQNQKTDTKASAQKTGRELDVMIQGEGFFQVLDDATGQTFYTRFGRLNINPDGNLTIKSASTERLLEPAIMIPKDTTKITVSADGIVSVKQADSPEVAQAGQIEMAAFINPNGLLEMGENLYAETDASGGCIQNSPGQEGMGTFVQGSLENSKWSRLPKETEN